MEPELLPQRPRPAGLQLQLFGMLKQSRRTPGRGRGQHSVPKLRSQGEQMRGPLGRRLKTFRIGVTIFARLHQERHPPSRASLSLFPFSQTPLAFVT